MVSGPPLRVGVVGADPRGFGSRAHIPAVKQSATLELHAICTNHEETAKAAAQEHGVPRWYSSIESMLEDGAIDLVTIAVRPAHHSHLALAAIEHDTPVYCEWPLARSSHEAKAMTDAASLRSIPTATGLQGRFSPVLCGVSRSVGSGEIGSPLSFSASLVQSPFRVDSDRAWLTRSSEASGALYVATAHLSDMLEFAIGKIESLVAVTGTYRPDGTFGDNQSTFQWEAEDTVQYLAKLESGVSGVINVSNTASKPSGFHLQILGDDGQIDVRAPEYLQFSPVTAQISHRSGQTRTDKPSDISVEWAPSTNVGRALTAFGTSLLEGGKFEPSFAAGERLHTILDAIEESNESSEWVDIDTLGQAR